MQFTDLHLHSTFSCLDAWGLPKQILKRAKDLGRKTIAVTDHASISGYVQFSKVCKDNNIKMIYGIEPYMVNSISSMFENKERKKNHITLLAENEKGYKNILKLASEAYNNFYYYPTIDWNLLFDNSEGIILLSGCWGGIVQRLLFERKVDEAEKLIYKIKNVFGDRFYLETQHYTLFNETFKILYALSKKTETPIVLTCDVHFLEKGQAFVQEMLHAIRERRQFDDKLFLEDAYQWNPDDLFSLVKTRFGNEGNLWDKIFDNVNIVSERCNAAILKDIPPKFPFKNKEDSKEELIKLCKSGIISRGLKGGGKVYQERFDRELKVIKEKNFIDYLLIVADLVNWAKTQGILTGAGRGSSSGSLICNLLGITELDPIKHDLLFDRFIDETRSDLPDIDTDFDSDKRDLVKDYAAETFGKNKVCDVVTFARFKGKNSLDETGKMFSIPINVVKIVKDYLFERNEKDERGYETIKDTFQFSKEAQKVAMEYPDILKACFLEGQLRHMGKHAAGIIIGNKPLEETIAVYEKKGRKISSVEMDDAFDLGLIKIDLLGVKVLSILNDIANKIGMKAADIYNIPLTDKKTIKGFQEYDVDGIFQFEGDAAKNVLKQMPKDKIDFDQIAASVALARPGPLQSGSANSYFSVMKENKKVKNLDWHPIIYNITKKTFGQIVYQEQVMKILREFANFSIEDTNKCRKIMGKTEGKQEFEKYYSKFLEGVKDKIDDTKARDIWEIIKLSGEYLFNRSHAVAYALLAFQSMYFKQHYPLEFYVSRLNYEDDEEKRLRILLDVSRSGIRILPPQLGKSSVFWKVENNSLRSGLREIKGIGEKTAEKLVSEEYFIRKDFDKNKIKGITQTAFKALDNAHAFLDDIPLQDFFGIYKFNILNKISPERKLLETIKDQNISGSFIVGGIFVKMTIKDILETKRVKGLPTDKVKNPDKSKYAVMILSDETDRCLAFIDRFLFFKIGKKISDAVDNEDFVLIEGTKNMGWNMINIKDIVIYDKKGKVKYG